MPAFIGISRPRLQFQNIDNVEAPNVEATLHAVGGYASAHGAHVRVSGRHRERVVDRKRLFPTQNTVLLETIALSTQIRWLSLNWRSPIQPCATIIASVCA